MIWDVEGSLFGEEVADLEVDDRPEELVDSEDDEVELRFLDEVTVDDDGLVEDEEEEDLGFDFGG